VASSSTEISEDNELEGIKQHKSTSLKRSLDMANKMKYSKKQETRDEKINRLMGEYDRN